VDEVPISPEKVLKALRKKAKGEEGRVGPTSFPDITWPAPTRVATPWEGGDGKASGDGGLGQTEADRTHAAAGARPERQH
jgi:hypothetical protein